MAEVGTKGLGVSEGPEKARVPGEQRTRGRVARGEVAEAGRLQMTQSLVDSGKEFRFHFRFSGEPMKGFKEENNRIYVLERPLWLLFGEWVQGDKRGNGETSQEAVVIAQETWTVALNWTRITATEMPKGVWVHDVFQR